MPTQKAEQIGFECFAEGEMQTTSEFLLEPISKLAFQAKLQNFDLSLALAKPDAIKSQRIGTNKF